ncbi:MAG: ABC transporter permease [Lactobacillus sp.]|nr:ABC transporter permease [Lactobacillus sp.]
MADNVKITPDSFKPANNQDNTQKEEIQAPSLTFFQDAVRRLKQNKVAVVAFWVLAVMIIIALLAPVIAPHNPNTQNVNYANLPPKIGSGNIPGFTGKGEVAGVVSDRYAAAGVSKGTYYILGTDYLGRDLLSRIIYGTRLSIFVAFAATMFDMIIGVPYGLISAWRGKFTDIVMQRIIEIISSVPNLIVAILMLLIFKPGLTSIIIAIGFTGWITMARLIRAETYQLESEEYILAAQTLGESSLKIAFKHLIPNMSSVIIINTMMTIPTAIFFEAFLSYIGIGIPAPNASLGTLLSDGQKTFRFLPYQMWYPSAVIVLLMLAFNLLADGLRDAFDPKSSR